MADWRFLVMIVTSTVAMSGLAHASSYALEHVDDSESRLYMALSIGATMAVIMPGFMPGTPAGEAAVETVVAARATPGIATVFPDPMSADEIGRALGTEATCTFLRAADADLVLAVADGRGVAKVSGGPILPEGDDATMTAEGNRMTLRPPETDDAERTDPFVDPTTEPPLRVGYDGYWTCN